MKKYLKMTETIIDIETMVEFIKGRMYEVLHEYEDHYILANQNNMVCGIGKECEGVKYVVVEE